ncbi:DUF1983 domain-containing protein, partial [Moellerella wisconsensis]
LRAEFKSDFDDTNSLINENKSAIAETNKSIAKVDRDLNARVGKAEGSIGETQKAVADNERAQAETNALIKSELGENKAAIEKRAETSVDQLGNSRSYFSIKSGVLHNGQYYDVKMMMNAEVKNGEVVTQIGFSADTFGIFNPSSGKLEPVFFVENGQVFINEAFINQATIEKIIVGTDMRSKNYVADKLGTRIDMNNGVIEINGSDGNGGRMTIKNDQLAVFKGNKPKIIIGRLYGI